MSLCEHTPYHYINEKYIGKTIEDVMVIDFNSFYPTVLTYNKFPYGRMFEFKNFNKKNESFENLKN